MKKQERLEKKKRKAVALMTMIKINDEDKAKRATKHALDLDSDEEVKRIEEVRSKKNDELKGLNRFKLLARRSSKEKSKNGRRKR